MFVLDLDGDGRADYVEAVVCIKEACDYRRYVDLARDGGTWVVVAESGND